MRFNSGFKGLSQISQIFFFQRRNGLLVGQGPLIIGALRPHCRTYLDEWSARCRDLYVTTHNTQDSDICLNPQSQEASCRRLTP